ncbi:MAG: hypothetical protein WC675_05760 [Patescibacteria group bacterium]|jgi:hypothetical protein
MADAKEVKKDKKRNPALMLALIRYHKLITALLVILIIFLSYQFILEPKYQQVSLGGRYNLATLEEELNKRETYLNSLKELAGNYQKISQEQVENLKKILPAEKDIPSLFVQLQALTEQHNLILATISINEISEASSTKKSKVQEETPPAPGIKKLDISLNLIGKEGGNNYLAVKEFLTTLESNLRLFDVNSVYFSPTSANYSINLFTYYY